MLKTVLIRMTARPAVAAAFALLAACAPNPPPAQAVQPIPPGPTPEEVANYATAQIHYRFGLATGDGDAVAAANETFSQIPREVFSRQNPRLFAAELVCEQYRVARPAATGSSMPTSFDPQCRNIEWRYDEATDAIRQGIEAQIAAADLATLAQAGPGHR